MASCLVNKVSKYSQFSSEPLNKLYLVVFELVEERTEKYQLMERLKTGGAQTKKCLLKFERTSFRSVISGSTS